MKLHLNLNKNSDLSPDYDLNLFLRNPGQNVNNYFYRI
jgi:hypothetical protein